MSLRILHTSDFHGKLDDATTSILKRLREDADALYFDCGDVIRAGNLATPTKPDPGWDRLREIGLTACTLGNRETHVLKKPFAMKLEGSSSVLVANLGVKGEEGVRIGQVDVGKSLLIERKRLRIGLFGVMVPMVTARMKTQSLSAFLWDQPIPVAVALAKVLRPQCDILIALTHIGYRRDLELAEAVPEIDVILGGHSHTVLQQPERVGKTWISHTGSHGRFAGLYDWEAGDLTGGLVSL